MLQSILNSTTIPLLERAAAFNERRQEVLAGNIANIDTPNYRKRDLPVDAFRDSLRNMIAQRRAGTSNGSRSNALAGSATRFPGMTAAGRIPHVGSIGASRGSAIEDTRELFQAVEVQPSRDLTFQDGNNRSLEREMMELTKNVMMQSYAVEIMATQMNMIETAIVGRA